LTFTAIGRQLGVTRQRAHQLFQAALAAILSPAVEALRAEHLAETAEARRRVLEVLGTKHVVVQQGHVVSEITGEDDEGRPIYGAPLIDHGPTLDAVRTLAAIQAREAKLVGADAPTKVEATVTEIVDPQTIELRQLIAERQAANAVELARLAAESTEEPTS
jgi:negative regulator of sigma E activity